MIKFFLFLFTIQIVANPTKTYKIVIDPGHGGFKQEPLEFYGDKFDTITQRYLEHYKDGASYKGIRTEQEIVLEIGKELKEILDLTKTKKGFQKFSNYIKQFSDTETPWIELQTSMTRVDSYKDFKFREKEDKNKKYRLYDFPDFKTNKNVLGRISLINKEKPHLVVSLHINAMNTGPGASGMGAVIAPSYQTFDLLKRISEKKASKEEFEKLEWKNWMIFENSWTRLENAIADSWIYFNGYWPTKDGNQTDRKKFEGYRYNMVTWRYRDSFGWEKKINDKEGPYSLDHKGFKANGKFWDRERSKLETMRREGGLEGYGGDNHYASTELLRFVQYGLRNFSEEKDTYKEPGPILRPYVSTYSIPTFINAISGYLELGEITSDKDMYFLTSKKKRVAISLAVGIYSLFHGLELKSSKSNYTPKGKRIEFEKYIGTTGQSYFDEVMDMN